MKNNQFSPAPKMVQLSELEQEPYDSEEFVERLAWRTTGQQSTQPAIETDPDDPFDHSALQLHDAFVQAIKDLTLMHEAQTKKCEALEQVTVFNLHNLILRRVLIENR